MNKENTYSRIVDKIEVVGKSHKEFTLNYLREIAKKYKDLPVTKRMKSYIEYFVNNFSYDKSMRDNKLNKANKKSTTKQGKEKELFDLFYSNKGVCEQFSVGFSLLCKLDKDLSKSFNVYLVNCSIETDREMAHALNILTNNDGIFMLDISSMIHCKEKDAVGSIWDYGFVSIEKYIENQKRNNFKIIPNSKDGTVNLLTYRNNTTENVEDYYELLTQPSEVMNKELRKEWFSIDISSYFQEQSLNQI